MKDMSITADTSHVLSGWLNAQHPLNMQDVSVTADTSHVSSGWSNTRQSLNMQDILMEERNVHEIPTLNGGPSHCCIAHVSRGGR